MKASLAALAGALLIASCPWTLAASNVDLTVKGSITPSACTPSISSNGLVDYGKISVQDLDVSITPLPPVVFKLAVNCEGSSLFALASLDNRLPSHNPNAYYVLGYIDPSKWIGAYFLTLRNVQTDDPTAFAIYSTDDGSSWDIYTPEWNWAASSLTAFGKGISGRLAPVAIKDMSLDLLVEPFIYGRYSIPAGEPIALDGSATFELRYL